MGKTNAFQRLLGPFSDVRGRVPLRVACNQRDKVLLHHKCFCDAVSKDAEQAHAVVRPEVATDGWADPRLEKTLDEVATHRLAVSTEQRQLARHGLAARQRIVEASLAQL